MIAPRDKIESENIRKYNKIFKSLEAKISSVTASQQNVKKETAKNSETLASLESKILETFAQQIEEMKRLQPSPAKGSFIADGKIENRLREIEERIDEKSLQTVSLFDSAKEEIQHNKKNLEQFATLCSSLTESLKQLHKTVNDNEADWK